MMNPRPFLLNAGRIIFLIGISISALASVLAQAGNTPGATATANGDATIPADLAFDVVSIRPSNAGPDQWRMQVLPEGDQFVALGMPLGATILMAYFPIRMGRDRIIGAPNWVWNDTYDVVGKVNEADLSAWHKFTERGLMMQNPMLQIMLQNALADRCKLSVHRVPTQIDGYALVVANHGLNRKHLAESQPDEAIPDRALKISVGGRMVPIYSPDHPVLHFYQTSMAALVLMISGSTPIEDRTGLPGKYKFDLTRWGNEGIPSDWDLVRLASSLSRRRFPLKRS